MLWGASPTVVMGFDEGVVEEGMEGLVSMAPSDSNEIQAH